MAPTLIAGGGKFAYGYKVNNYGASGNGVVFSGTSHSALPTGVNELAIGYRGNFLPNNHINGHIKRLAYFPTRLTDEQLTELTK